MCARIFLRQQRRRCRSPASQQPRDVERNMRKGQSYSTSLGRRGDNYSLRSGGCRGLASLKIGALFSFSYHAETGAIVFPFAGWVPPIRSYVYSTPPRPPQQHAFRGGGRRHLTYINAWSVSRRDA